MSIPFDVANPLIYEIAVIRSELEQAQLNETDITRLFLCAKEQLKSGTLENRRMIIEQYIDKVVVFEDRVEIHLNMIGDFKMKEIITK